MNEIPTHTPPEGVNGPTLGRDLPDGCERMSADCDPMVMSFDWWSGNQPVSARLYWWRFPPLKVGDTVQPHPESRDLIEVADLDGGRQVCTAPTPPPVPPNPMAVREFAAKVADYVSTHQNADGMSKRGWAIEAVVQALEEPTASQEARSILAPTPPWPGAVLSGLVDEDGVPTWLAQAGQVRGEQVRGWRDMAWYRPHGHSSDTWVEVRAPRAVPEPETERVDAWEAVKDGRRVVGASEPFEAHYIWRSGPNRVFIGERTMDRAVALAPDGTVEVLKDGDR